MKSGYLRICQLLASSGFREQEIADFAHEVCQSTPAAFVDYVRHLRKFLSESTQDRDFDIPNNSRLLKSDVETKIERLLIQEAGLPRAVAVEQLTTLLQSRFPNSKLPPEARKGFRVWIRKLTALIPEKELLHIATSLRNRMVHEAPSDWRLK